VTALARHTLRAAALSGQSATEMLATLHLALQRQPPGADLCTVCLVTMNYRARPARLTVALAGHHPPLLVDRGGKVKPVGQPGTLLGVIDPISIAEAHVDLAPGETLLMYTDGVIEAGRPAGELGERHLRELAARAPELALSELLAEIEHEAVERAAGSLRDDIALLALRLTDGAP
jgi:sigma-B regulation protein RsbU (phosphoserine phosphatase)